MNLKIIDLFSGAGGFSKGFEYAGFVTKFGFDFDDKALETFSLNHGDGVGIKANLFLSDEIQRVIEMSAAQGIIGIIGGPPCQGFSLAGPRREDDPRNKLYFAMIKTAKQLLPKFIVIENVPSLSTLYEGKALKSILEDLRGMNYHVKYSILKASDFGVPQIRRRLFLVAFKDIEHYNRFEFPKPTTDSNNYLTVGDAISDLPLLGDAPGSLVSKYTTPPKTDYQKRMRKKTVNLYNHENSKHSEKTIKMLKMIDEGRNAKSLPEPWKSDFNYNDALTRLSYSKPSRTIDTGHRTIFHPKENRVPSVREAARIQSFPDEFIFCGNKSQQYRQVGNAVPPLLAEAIAKKIREALNE